MKTELLNEYIFAALLSEEANRARRQRCNRLTASGLPDNEIPNHLLEEDFRIGYDALERSRSEAVKLQQESLSEPPK